MEKDLTDLLYQIELHDPDGIRHCFERGVSAVGLFKGRPLIEELIGEYTRTPRFKDCIRVFMEHGHVFEDKALQAVLTDDAVLLRKCIELNPSVVNVSYELPCAYTPLYKVSLLHICAEFNHTACGQLLLEAGVNVNSEAGVDTHGFGGHTPIFHTVNQNANASAAMMQLLLDHGASLSKTVTGFIWGKGYEWETLIPAVNPVSYAMMGLLPQMHRDEITIMNVVSVLLSSSYGISYTPQNVPCRYLIK